MGCQFGSPQQLKHSGGGFAPPALRAKLRSPLRRHVAARSSCLAQLGAASPAGCGGALAAVLGEIDLRSHDQCFSELSPAAMDIGTRRQLLKAVWVVEDQLQIIGLVAIRCSA